MLCSAWLSTLSFKRCETAVVTRGRLEGKAGGAGVRRGFGQAFATSS